MNGKAIVSLFALVLTIGSGAALVQAQQDAQPAGRSPEAKVYYSVPAGSYSGLREGERIGRPVAVDLTLGQGGTGTLVLYQGYFKNDCAGRYAVTSAEVKGEMLTVIPAPGIPGCPGTLVLQIVDGGRKLVGHLDSSKVELTRR